MLINQVAAGKLRPVDLVTHRESPYSLHCSAFDVKSHILCRLQVGGGRGGVQDILPGRRDWSAQGLNRDRPQHYSLMSAVTLVTRALHKTAMHVRSLIRRYVQVVWLCNLQYKTRGLVLRFLVTRGVVCCPNCSCRHPWTPSYPRRELSPLCVSDAERHSSWKMSSAR